MKISVKIHKKVYVAQMHEKNLITLPLLESTSQHTKNERVSQSKRNTDYLSFFLLTLVLLLLLLVLLPLLFGVRILRPHQHMFIAFWLLLCVQLYWLAACYLSACVCVRMSCVLRCMYVNVYFMCVNYKYWNWICAPAHSCTTSTTSFNATQDNPIYLIARHNFFYDQHIR